MHAMAVWEAQQSPEGWVLLWSSGRELGARRLAGQAGTQHFTRLGGGGETWLEVVLNNEWVVLHGSRRECLRPPATGELVWGLFKGAEGGVNW